MQRNYFTILCSFLVFGILLFGCLGSSPRAAVMNAVQGENITVSGEGYSATLNGKYWIPFTSGQKALTSLITGSKASNLFSSYDEETVLLVTSANGYFQCDFMNARDMDFAELESAAKQFNGRIWCIGKGYETSPQDYMVLAISQCGDNFVALGMTGSPESRKAQDEQELYNILKTFKCSP